MLIACVKKRSTQKNPSGENNFYLRSALPLRRPPTCISRLLDQVLGLFKMTLIGKQGSRRELVREQRNAVEASLKCSRALVAVLS